MTWKLFSLSAKVWFPVNKLKRVVPFTRTGELESVPVRYTSFLTGELDSLRSKISRCSSSSGGRSFKQPDTQIYQWQIERWNGLRWERAYVDGERAYVANGFNYLLTESISFLTKATSFLMGSAKPLNSWYVIPPLSFLVIKHKITENKQMVLLIKRKELLST